MNFKELLLDAKTGEHQAFNTVFEMYQPLLIKMAVVIFLAPNTELNFRVSYLGPR